MEFKQCPLMIGPAHGHASSIKTSNLQILYFIFFFSANYPKKQFPKLPLYDFNTKLLQPNYKLFKVSVYHCLHFSSQRKFV